MFSGLRLPSSRHIEPVGASITVGRKGPNGNPVDKDRYFIQSARADGSGREGRKYPHPDFEQFNVVYQGDNAQDKTAHNSKRRTIRGVLVHSRQDDCHESRLQAYMLPDMPANDKKELGRRPACGGNGTIAMRWNPKDGCHTQIDCTPACPYLRRPERGQPPCTVFSRLFFQLRWAPIKDAAGNMVPSPLSTPLVQYASKGWETSETIKGMFEHVRQQAMELGVKYVDFYGLPFRMTLEDRTGSGSRFQVSTFTLDFDGGRNLQGWLLEKAQRREQMNNQRAYMQITSREAQDMIPEIINDLSVGNPADS